MGHRFILVVSYSDNVHRTPCRQRKNPLVFLFVGLLIVGLFDHYLLTLPSGLLLFFFVIGLSGESLHSSFDIHFFL